MKKIFAALVLLAALASCKSRIYEYDDGEWQRKAEEKETATVIIIMN